KINDLLVPHRAQGDVAILGFVDPDSGKQFAADDAFGRRVFRVFRTLYGADAVHETQVDILSLVAFAMSAHQSRQYRMTAVYAGHDIHHRNPDADGIGHIAGAE